MNLSQRLTKALTPGWGLLSWLIAVLMVNFVLSSVIESRWANGLVDLTIVGIGGMVVGGLLTRWQSLPSMVAHLIGLITGMIWCILQINLDSRLTAFGDRFNELFIRLLVLIRHVKLGESSEDYYLFIFGGLMLAWLLGYASIWLLLRHQWSWRVVLLNGLVLMLNLTYASPKPKASFWAFLGAGLLLVVFETFRSRQRRWNAGALEQQEWLSLRFLWAGLVACVSLLILAALLPASITNAQLRLLGDRLSRPFNSIQRVLHLPGAGESVGAPRAAPNRANFANSSVTLGGARVATNRVVLEVKSTRAEYWRANAWDFYNGRGWENTTGTLAQSQLGTSTKRAALTSIGPDNTMIQIDNTAREPLTQTITLRQARGDQQLPAATTPLTWSVPVLVQNTYIKTPGGEEPIPNFTDSSIYFNQGDATEGMTYTVVSLISVADKQSLRESSTDYPAWTQRYLQLPENPEMRQIAALTRQILAAQDARNPYDKAAVIEQYLRSMPYDDQIPSPPADVDPIANFLFNLKRGYCDYFAGSMVLMLRSQGIPARWVQGYATGEFDPELGAYVVRDTIAHSWPEVYFTGYGWQRFEPTPAGYVTVPRRPELPPNIAANSEEDDIGPNGGIVNTAPVQPDFEALQELRDELANQTPAPTPPPNVLLPDEDLAPVPASSPLLRWLLILVALAALIAASVWLFVQREIHGLRPASRAYALVGQLAQWAGYPQPAERTPSEYAEQLGKHMPSQRNALRKLSDAYTSEKYSRVSKIDPHEIRNTARPINQRLARRAFRRTGRTLVEYLGRQRQRWRSRSSQQDD